MWALRPNPQISKRKGKKKFVRLVPVLKPHPREFFDYAAIYIPCRGENLPAMWVDLTNTVWQGPEALEMYPPLSKLTPYEGNTKLRNLFVEILELGDANWKHCLKQLRQWKADSTMQNRCSDVYQYIRMEWEDFREDEVESIR